MAEAPPGGLFRGASSAVVDGARLEVTAASPGPAGVSAMELPDGSVIEVDHADPGRLVAVDLDAHDAATSLLLVAAFGGDGALQLLDDADRGDVPRWRDDRFEPTGIGQAMTSAPRFRGDAAAEFGRLVLLVDLVGDPSIDPVARIAAAAEAATSLAATPGGDLLHPLLPALISDAERLAAGLDPGAVPSLGAKQRVRLVGALRQLRGRGSGPLPGLQALVWRLQQRRSRPDDGNRFRAARSLGDAALADADLADADLTDPGAAERGSADGEVAALRTADMVFDRHELDADATPGSEPPHDGIEVRRATPSLLRVTVSRGEQQRWVRVLRRDGLVLLGLVPLRRDGLVDRAEVVVPPDTLDAEIDVQLVEADAASGIADRPADLVRAAVRAGRTAASAERAGSRGAAHELWRECSELWERLGDQRRAELARTPRRRGGRFGGPAPLSDLVTWHVDTTDPWA